MIRYWLNRFLGRSVRQPLAVANYSPLPPHPANVPGTFYVEDGCCISCGVWEDVAPDGETPHCYVSHQPETEDEFGRMMDAMHVGEVDCIRARNGRVPGGGVGTVDPWQDQVRVRQPELAG